MPLRVLDVIDQGPRQLGHQRVVEMEAAIDEVIVEFAQQGLLAGKPPMEAAVEAARLRFRPIVMTSLAFVFGMVPLVIATGAGAAARQSMGSGVFGGMIIATFIAPIFVPLFFTLFARREKTPPKAPTVGGAT